VPQYLSPTTCRASPPADTAGGGHNQAWRHSAEQRPGATARHRFMEAMHGYVVLQHISLIIVKQQNMEHIPLLKE
jgi:hypothetical protein